MTYERADVNLSREEVSALATALRTGGVPGYVEHLRWIERTSDAGRGSFAYRELAALERAVAEVCRHG